MLVASSPALRFQPNSTEEVLAVKWPETTTKNATRQYGVQQKTHQATPPLPSQRRRPAKTASRRPGAADRQLPTPPLELAREAAGLYWIERDSKTLGRINCSCCAKYHSSWQRGDVSIPDKAGEKNFPEIWGRLMPEDFEKKTMVMQSMPGWLKQTLHRCGRTIEAKYMRY